ncbi:MAG: hypothetical protein ABR503_09415, partial [Chitinophagaceae bacterium]
MKRILLLALIAFFCQSSHSQLLKKIKESKPIANLAEGKKPITTNFKDVDLDGKLAPSFGENENYKPLHSMPKNDDGEYLLTPGFYQITNLSYCLKAGTNGPAKGDAYGLAFLEGKMDDIVEVILEKSQQMWRDNMKDSLRGAAATLASNVFRLTQKDVQLLLWAIIAKTNFEDMAGRTKAVALALLTADQILKLNGGAVKTAANFAMDKGLVDKPVWMQKIEEAEHNLRNLYARGDATYEDFERLAVLAGIATEPNPVETGTWFKKGDFFVRFEPQGYPRTTIKVYVPEGKDAKFKATTMVATPSDSRQRLAQTDMAVEEYHRSPFGKL